MSSTTYKFVLSYVDWFFGSILFNHFTSSAGKKKILLSSCGILDPFVEWYFDVCIVFFADETAKWEKITYAGIATCTTLAIFILSKGHAHHEEPPVSFFWAHLNISNWSTRPWITRVPFLFAISLFIRWTLQSGHWLFYWLSDLYGFMPCVQGPMRVSRVYFILWISYFLTEAFLWIQAYPYMHIRNKEFPWGMFAISLWRLEFNGHLIPFVLVFSSIDFILFGVVQYLLYPYLFGISEITF